jgi:DNA polymerase/3'-5' exonuclease PolX
MRLEIAQEKANQMLEAMRPFCERCEIAGSVRRQKSQPKDIEIVAIPRWTEVPDPTDLFGEKMTRINQLYINLTFRVDLVWIKPGTRDLVPWNIDPKGKYWRGLLGKCSSEVGDDVVLDLFLVKPENWGIQFAIRTGNAEFSQGLVTRAKRIGYPCIDGYLTDQGRRIETREEQDVFDLLNINWVEPHLRNGFSAIRPK